MRCRKCRCPLILADVLAGMLQDPEIMELGRRIRKRKGDGNAQGE